MLFRTTLLATALLAAPALGQEAAPDLSRAARGDLTQPGGARRIEGDRTEQFRQLIEPRDPVDTQLTTRHLAQ